MGLTKITPYKVRERIIGARQDLQSSESAFDKITGVMSSLSAVWSSPAQQEFISKFNTGKSEIQKFNSGMDQHLSLINTITDEWDSVDKSISRPIESYVSETTTGLGSVNILDDAYLSEYAKNCTRMRQLLIDAERELDKADNNTGWHCPERAQVAERIATMQRSIRTLGDRFDAISHAVKTGASNYLSWEHKNIPLADNKAAEMGKSFSFSAKNWAKGVAGALTSAKTNAADYLKSLPGKLLPTTTIPLSPVAPAKVSKPTDWWEKSDTLRPNLGIFLHDLLFK